MIKYVINLKSATERLEKYNLEEFKRHEATSRQEVSEELDKRIVSMYNLPRHNHLARCACFHSHYTLLKKIVFLKQNNVLILEDDAIPSGHPMPDTFDPNALTYVAGWFHQIKMMDNSQVIYDSKCGVNELGDFRIVGAVAYVIPRWEVAAAILEHLDNKKRWRAIDIEFYNLPIDKKYIYPAPYLEDRSESQIDTKRKRYTNEYYKLI